uniref:Reverse transcriptase/retrotransposon-derived protein RNase H-like domain-containing protein n=1 Tax=Dromaius novaehollandiae TaxID=8790 RepID=A0A8C4JHY8_DRONO
TKKEEIKPLAWGPAREKAFTSVKKALVSAPALGLHDYSKLFELFVHERQGVASGVLTQKLGPHRRPVAYYSMQLDEVAKGTPGCIRATAATAALIEKTRPLLVSTAAQNSDHSLMFGSVIAEPGTKGPCRSSGFQNYHSKRILEGRNLNRKSIYLR